MQVLWPGISHAGAMATDVTQQVPSFLSCLLCPCHYCLQVHAYMLCSNPTPLPISSTAQAHAVLSDKTERADFDRAVRRRQASSRTPSYTSSSYRRWVLMGLSSFHYGYQPQDSGGQYGMYGMYGMYGASHRRYLTVAV